MADGGHVASHGKLMPPAIYIYRRCTFIELILSSASVVYWERTMYIVCLNVQTTEYSQDKKTYMQILKLRLCLWKSRFRCLFRDRNLKKWTKCDDLYRYDCINVIVVFSSLFSSNFCAIYLFVAALEIIIVIDLKLHGLLCDGALKHHLSIISNYR